MRCSSVLRLFYLWRGHNMNTPLPSVFTTYRSIRVPRPLLILCVLIVTWLIGSTVLLVSVPWVQTAHGTGKITSLNPDGQLQAIHALVKGRVHRWHVRDGSAVKAGDPIVDILDNDPLILDRLEAERNSLAAARDAAKIAAETALLNYRRQEELHRQGLSARREMEQAKIAYKSWLAQEAEAASKLAISQTRLSRQHTQRIVAPKDGMIVRTFAGDSATLVSEGDVLAEFLPANSLKAVALTIRGLDMPLVRIGQKVRLQFEGWPMVQFSGWPSVAVGTFGGVVAVVDSSALADGSFRILVTQPEGETWPDDHYLRFGARAQGWVQLNTVPLGYELWRQLNGFPPERPAIKGKK